MAIKHLAPKAPKTIINGGSEEAPFVYFDGVIAFAIHEGNGIVQLELAANHLLAIQDGDKTGIRPKVLTVAHLRCSISTLRGLAEVCDRMLDDIDAPTRKAAPEPPPA